MMPPSNSPPAPTAPRPRRDAGVGSTTADELGNQLWAKVLAATGPLEIHDNCEQQLGAIVQKGAERMFRQGRTTAQDIALAEENIERLVGLMKHQAELLGHPQWLGEDTLGEATKALQVMRFELWPFWPW